MMAMVIFVGGTMGLLIRFIILPHLTQEMENRGAAVVRRLVESTRTFILTRDIDALTISLFDEKQLEKSIAYIVVGDHEDRLLTHTFVGQVPDIDPRGLPGCRRSDQAWSRCRRSWIAGGGQRYCCAGA